MSQARKQLKIISFIQVVVALRALATGVILIVQNASTPNSLAGCADVLAAVLSIAAAAQGIKGANVPSRLGPHTMLNVVGLICALIAAVVILVTTPDGEPINTLWSVSVVVVDAFSAAFGSRVRKELDR